MPFIYEMYAIFNLDRENREQIFLCAKYFVNFHTLLERCIIGYTFAW